MCDSSAPSFLARVRGIPGVGWGVSVSMSYRCVVEGPVVRVHLKAAAGLSSTGSTDQVPAGAIRVLVECVRRRGHQIGGSVQLKVQRGGGGGEDRNLRAAVAPALFYAHWLRE